MEAPSPRYILTRAVFLIAAVVVVLYGVSFIKRKQRQSAIVAELKSIASDSSFFQQFYAADAQKSLVKAIALMAEANQLGLSPDKSIDGGLGIERKYFTTDEEMKEPSAHDKIIRSSLRSNYENFGKLGYTADFHTLQGMKTGELPAIPSGPQSGQKPEIGTIIDPALSPGMERVIANLELRPARPENAKPSDVEVAAAKQLARDLYEAGIIEESARDRILEKLSPDAKPGK
ncbi:MAG: hypothetical protein ABIT37_16385 [Luteolibacter sp.]